VLWALSRRCRFTIRATDVADASLLLATVGDGDAPALRATDALREAARRPAFHALNRVGCEALTPGVDAASLGRRLLRALRA